MEPECRELYKLYTHKNLILPTTFSVATPVPNVVKIHSVVSEKKQAEAHDVFYVRSLCTLCA
jgi:hypothetical protein